MARVKDMTNGRIMPLILAYFFPVLCSTLFQQLYNVVDTIIVGKGISDNALGAVGASGSISFFMFGFIMGLGSGMSVLMSQAFGVGHITRLKKALTMGVISCGSVALAIMVFSLIYIKQLLIFMEVTPVHLEDATTYISIIIMGLPITFVYNCFAITLNALGNSKTPFIAVIIATAINVVLDLFFIMKLGMGVEGAAIATLIAQMFSALFCYNVIRKIDILKLTKDDWKLDKKVIMDSLRIGVPVAFMNSITAIGCIVLQVFVNKLGPLYTDAYAACSKIRMLFTQPATAVGMTMTTFAGQNMGAGKIKRIKDGVASGILLSLVITLIGSSALIFFPDAFSRMFVTDQAIIDASRSFLKISGIMLWSICMLFVTRSTCQGMGFTFIPMISGILELVARVVTVLLLEEKYGFDGIAVAEVAAWASAMVLNTVYLAIKLRELRMVKQ